MLALPFLLILPVMIKDSEAQLVSRVLQPTDITKVRSISDDIIAKRFPILESSCVQRALSDFLPQCLVYGIETISTETHTHAAVQLSLCELEASGIEELPADCMHMADISGCVRALEKSPQLWTTYSGNYQRLPSICFENSLPFEKEQLLALFLNITEVYRGFQNELLVDFDGFRRQVDETTQRSLETMKNNIAASANEIIEELNTNLGSVNHQVGNISEVVSESTAKLRDIFVEASEELRELDLGGQIASLKESTISTWDDFNGEMVSYQEAQLNNWRIIDEMFHDFYLQAEHTVHKIRDSIIDSQADTVDILNDFNNLMSDSIVPSIKDGLAPEIAMLSELVADQLSEIDSRMETTLDSWDAKLNDTFSSIGSYLNESMGKISEMNESIGVFQSRLGTLLSIVNTFTSAMARIFVRIRSLVGSYDALLIGITSLLYKIHTLLPCSLSVYLAKSMLVMVAAKFGVNAALLFSR